MSEFHKAERRLAEDYKEKLGETSEASVTDLIKLGVGSAILGFDGAGLALLWIVYDRSSELAKAEKAFKKDVSRLLEDYRQEAIYDLYTTNKELYNKLIDSIIDDCAARYLKEN